MTFIQTKHIGPSNSVIRRSILVILIAVILLPVNVFTARQFIEREALLRDEARVYTNFINSGIMSSVTDSKLEELKRLRDKIFERDVSIEYTDRTGTEIDDLSSQIKWPSVSVTMDVGSGTLHFATSVSDRLPAIKYAWLAGISILFLTIFVLVKFIFSRWSVAEKDEQEARQNLITVVDLSSDWFWESNEAGTIIDVISKDHLIIDAAELKGMVIWEIPYVEPIEHQSTLKSGFHQRQSLSFMLKVTQAGVTYWHRLRAAPYYSDDGTFLGYKGAGLDITSEQTSEQKIKQLQEVVVQAMGSLAETRDNETGHHIIRTKNYVKQLALALRHHKDYSSEIDELYIDLLYLSAPLHDIGKVGIPDSILCKPDKLTPEEFEIMKTHTTLGYEAIVRAEQALGLDLDFLKHAKDIALSHQEKWDGSGYPAGLSGQQIPLSARLMALADVYDALISRRVYKPPFSHETAVEIITEGKGKHFDPVVVDIFLQIHERFRQIAAQHADPEE